MLQPQKQSKIITSAPTTKKPKGLWSGSRLHRLPALMEITPEATRQQLALYNNRVPAGTPAEADDTTERQVTLTDILLHHPRETFLLRVTGDSMLGAGINDGDLLTVDRKLVAKDGDIVVATIDGQTTVKTLWHRADGSLVLQPQNDRHAAIEVAAESECTLLGVVTNVIRALY